MLRLHLYFTGGSKYPEGEQGIGKPGRKLGSKPQHIAQPSRTTPLPPPPRPVLLHISTSAPTGPQRTEQGECHDARGGEVCYKIETPYPSVEGGGWDGRIATACEKGTRKRKKERSQQSLTSRGIDLSR